MTQARAGNRSRLLFLCIYLFFKKNKKNLLPPLFKVNGGLILLSVQDIAPGGISPSKARHVFC